jgi:hypothetical protein
VLTAGKTGTPCYVPHEPKPTAIVAKPAYMAEREIVLMPFVHFFLIKTSLV